MKGKRGKRQEARGKKWAVSVGNHESKLGQAGEKAYPCEPPWEKGVQGSRI